MSARVEALDSIHKARSFAVLVELAVQRPKDEMANALATGLSQVILALDEAAEALAAARKEIS